MIDRNGQGPMSGTRAVRSFMSLSKRTIRLKLYLAYFALLVKCIYAHGLMSDPRQRGALRLDNHPIPTLDWNAPSDYAAHFPSGSKSGVPGAGTRSVMTAANNNWTPYNPLDRNFHWRAGVCGDEKGAEPQDHLKGGKYYYDAFRVREYVQGSVIFMESEIVTHHNGYFEFYVCNIDKCGDDISERCFQEGHCQKLMRTHGSCDSGNDMRCGPVDPWHPGRWYLPCRTNEPMMMGGWSRTIAYTLPRDLVCDHCVIQWYWVAHNYCNLEGVEEYFTSSYAPNWGDCPGQGGARGGWVSGKPDCGGEKFPEEYWQCADVRIVPNAPREHPHSTPLPSPTSPSTLSPGLSSFTPPEISIPTPMSSGGTSTSSAGSSSSSVQLDGFRGDPEEQPIQEQEEGSSDGRDLDFNEENRDDSDDERERDWNDPRFLSGEDNDDRSTLNNEEEVSSEEDDHHHIQESSGNDSVVTNIGARGRGNRPTEESESEAGEEEKIGSEKGPPDAQDNNGASTSGARDANKEKEQESKPDEEGLDSGSGGTDGDTDHAGALGIHHSQV